MSIKLQYNHIKYQQANNLTSLVIMRNATINTNIRDTNRDAYNDIDAYLNLSRELQESRKSSCKIIIGVVIFLAMLAGLIYIFIYGILSLKPKDDQEAPNVSRGIYLLSVYSAIISSSKMISWESKSLNVIALICVVLMNIAAVAGIVFMRVYGVFAIIAHEPFEHSDLTTGICLLLFSDIAPITIAIVFASILECCVS